MGLLKQIRDGCKIINPDRITYVYNALGQKVKKTVVMYEGEHMTPVVSDYLDGFQYVDEELQFFPTAQGYVRIVDNRFYYVFSYSDQVGNVRMNYGRDPENSETLVILEENHYYPYGLKHQNYNIYKLEYVPEEGGIILASVSALKNKYSYNGKEWQEELGYNMYDMPFRDYDPAIGKWAVIDPVVDFGRSNYNGYNGNPVLWSDPSGASPAKWLRDLCIGMGLPSSLQGMWAATKPETNSTWINLGDGIYGNPEDGTVLDTAKAVYDVLFNLGGLAGGGKVEAGPAEIIANNYQKTKPFVRNDTNGTVYFKPEEGSAPGKLKPGETTFIEIDAVNVNGIVTKITDNYDSVIIGQNFNVDATFHDAVSFYYYVAFGGIKNRSDFKAKEGWYPIFDILKKP